jgi:hypothetical protein
MEFTLWLAPSEPLRSTLRSIIGRLAADFGAVEFEPHVTVFCGPSAETEARAVARRIAEQFSPVELIVDRLEHTEIYTKTLFIQFQESVVLQQMFEATAAGYTQHSNYVLNPHLSLLYKKLPRPVQAELCDTIEIPTGKYGFDRVRMIETELPIEDAGPVRRWRTVCDEALTR